jgi:hypothetical protein
LIRVGQTFSTQPLSYTTQIGTTVAAPELMELLRLALNSLANGDDVNRRNRKTL